MEHHIVRSPRHPAGVRIDHRRFPPAEGVRRWSGPAFRRIVAAHDSAGFLDEHRVALLAVLQLAIARRAPSAAPLNVVIDHVILVRCISEAQCTLTIRTATQGVLRCAYTPYRRAADSTPHPILTQS